jgi:hypothetical protein
LVAGSGSYFSAFEPIIVNMRVCHSGIKKGNVVPFKSLEWPRGFQEFKVPENGTGWW